MTVKHDTAEDVYGQSRLECDNASQCFSPSWWHEECKHILQWTEEALSSCILVLSIMMARIANRPWSVCVQTVSLFQLHRTHHKNPHLPGKTLNDSGSEFYFISAKLREKNRPPSCYYYFFGRTEPWLSFWKWENVSTTGQPFSLEASNITGSRFPCELVNSVPTKRRWK